jgi:ArsR family transcriptional regulator, arsenate/arsenite/antimonite-responsive transcriptional repressor
MAVARQLDVRRINQMFRAFSEPMRLRILRLLTEGETCVGDLVTVLRAPQPSVSRHLSYLRKAGLVAVRKAGLWCYYSLAPASSEFHRRLVDCLTVCFDEVPAIRTDLKRLAGLQEKGRGCCPESPGQTTAEKKVKSCGDACS